MALISFTDYKALKEKGFTEDQIDQISENTNSVSFEPGDSLDTGLLSWEGYQKARQAGFTDEELDSTAGDWREDLRNLAQQTASRGPGSHSETSHSSVPADDPWAGVGSGGMNTPEAIGAGLENGIWNNGIIGGINLGAAEVGRKITSNDTNTLFGQSASRRGLTTDIGTIGQLRDIWSDYNPGDGTLGQNLKDSAFSLFHGGMKQLTEGSLRNNALYTGGNMFFSALKNFALPAITGSNNAEENAQWLTKQGYGLGDRLTGAVSSVPAFKYVDNNTYSAAVQQSSPANALAANVANVVGGMLPTIAVAAATKNPDIALTGMAASAAGNAAKEAYMNGATPEQAYYVGVEKGLVEYGTERMFDAFGVLGGSALSPAFKKVVGDFALTKFGRVLSKVGNTLGENVEEMASDWASPGIEKAVLGQTINNKIRSDLGLPEEDDDLSFAQAFLGQMPWTEQGLTTLLSTIVLGGATSIVRDRFVTVPKEAAEDILKIAKNSGNARLVNLAEEYNKILDKRGKLGIEKYGTLREATEARVGEDSVREQLTKSVQTRFAQNEGPQFVRAVFESRDINLRDGDIKAITDAYTADQGSFVEYTQAMQTVYRLATRKVGMSLENIQKETGVAQILTEPQMKLAYKLGQSMQTAEPVYADVSTEQGKQTLLAPLAALGKHADAAASVYEKTQDVQQFADAMERAVNLYAANGIDVKAVYQAAKEGKTNDIIDYLTPEQIDRAAEIGKERAKEVSLEAKEKATSLQKMKADAQALLDEKNPDILDINKNLIDLRGYIKTRRADLEQAVIAAEALKSTAPNSEAYAEAIGKVKAIRDDIRSAQGVIKQLEQEKKAEQKKHPRQHRQGKVTYSSEEGEIKTGGKTYKYSAVDKNTLTKTQRAVADMAETIAKVTGLNIRIVNIRGGLGGEYMQGKGGELVVNIGAEFKGKNFAAASMSHELTHWLKEYAPEEYQRLKQFILQEMARNPENYSRIFNLRQDTYVKLQNLSIDGITDEMVANACQFVLNDEATVRRLASQDRGLFEKIRDFVLKFVETVKAAFAEADINNGPNVFAEARAVQDAMDQIRELWMNAFETATENLQATGETATIEDAVKENDTPAVAESMSQLQLWEGEEPKQVQYGFKLMNVDKDGLPHAMFIDAAKPYELGTWYKADAPKMEHLAHLEPGYAYLVDENDNVDQKTRVPVEKIKTVSENGKTSWRWKGLPGKRSINQATDGGKRWIAIWRYTDGSKSYYNVGINGSGSVSTYALRPGIHAVDIPSMTHIGAKTGRVIDRRRPNQAWFLIEYPVDVDYNQEAYGNPDKDIQDHIPERGWYSFQTNSGAEANQHWFITGGMKIVGMVAEADARKYARDHGFEEDLPWKDGKSYSEDNAINLDEYMRTTKAQPTPSKEEMRQRIEAGRSQLQVYDDERQMNAYDNQIAELEDRLELATGAERNTLIGRLTKLYNDRDKLIAKERSLSRRTSINDILENLSRYRYRDLLSIAEQYSDGAWDIEPGTTREQLESDLREALEERAADMTVLERQRPSLGFYVRPADSVQFESTAMQEGIRTLSKATDENGNPLLQIYAFEHDEQDYRDMLTQWGGMSTKEINRLFTKIDKAVALIKKHLEELDFASDQDIDKRAFESVKKNSDDLYVVSVDFSTLCRKRILQGVIEGQLSAALQRAVTKEEKVAIRDALMALQEEGKQIEVACALCYVESARMRSQKAINSFLNNPEAAIRDYYASKNGKSQNEVERAEREKIRAELITEDNPDGMVRSKNGEMVDVLTTPMNRLPDRIKKRIQDAKKAARNAFALTEEQQAEVEFAKTLPTTTFTTPEGLEWLVKEQHDDIFRAYVKKVSAASKSKGIENDVWFRAGDTKKITDALIKKMNAENGLRSQSWSDFQVKHLIDYIAATIELSVRGAKMHAYTKVPDYVELMGQTGVMINMSLIPTREFNGTLEYDDVEGFVFSKAMELRKKFPETAGTICIGMDPEQIRLLLASTDIDYVIPYHQSGMSKATRLLMHIPAWKDFQRWQGEKRLSGKDARENAAKYGVKLLSTNDPNWHKTPNFSDWFDLEKAKATQERVGTEGEYGVMTGGYVAMQEAARRYMGICAERGLQPKFTYGNDDFSASPNYWKLLIDRKMVNNATGGIIEQKPLQPIFNEDTMLRILNEELARYGTVKADQDEAIERVTEAFLAGKVKPGMSAEEMAAALQKPVDNLAIPMLQAYDDQMTMEDYTRSQWAPEFRNRVESIEDVTRRASLYLKGLGPVGMEVFQKETGMAPDEVDKFLAAVLDPNYYNTDPLAATLYGADDLLRVLSKISARATGSKLTQAYELMEDLLQHTSAVTANYYTTQDGPLDEKFSAWYNKRHPSLYYKGYKPGDLFGMKGFDNREKERAHLHRLIDSGRLTEKDLEEAKSFLDRLNSPSGQTFYQIWDDGHNEWAPTFYSKMENTIREWTNGKGQPLGEKMAAGQVIGWLRGKGVKAEEIRWSGIPAYLEGKKSVTRDELLRVMAENSIRIETQTLKSYGSEAGMWTFYPDYDDPVTVDSFEELVDQAKQYAESIELDPDTVDVSESSDGKVYAYAEDFDGTRIRLFDANPAEFDPGETRWSEYMMPGGTQYREILFKMPMDYNNKSLDRHWGGDAPGTIAHARVQDMTDRRGKQVLFVDEIQSDLHNAGVVKDEKTGKTVNKFRTADNTEIEKRIESINAEKKDLQKKAPSPLDIYDLASSLLRRHMDTGGDGYVVSRQSLENWIKYKDVYDVYDGNIIDTRYVRREESEKRNAREEKLVLAMMTDEEKEFVRRVREYQSRISELNRQRMALDSQMDFSPPDVPFAGEADTYHEYVMKHLLRLAAEGGYDSIGWTTAQQQVDRWDETYAEGYRIEYDQNIPKFMKKYVKPWGGQVTTLELDNGKEVWGVDLTEAMAKDVLHVGQPLFQVFDDAWDDTAAEGNGRQLAYSRLRAENAILQQTIGELKKTVRGKDRSIGKLMKTYLTTRPMDATRLAKSLTKSYSSTANVEEVAAAIREVGDYFLQTPTESLDEEKLKSLAREAASLIAENAEEVVLDEDDAYTEIRGAIKGAKLSLSPEFTGELDSVGGYTAFKAANRGKFTVTRADRAGADYVSVESFYESLRGDFGDYYFPEPGSDNGPANEGEMVQIIADAFDAGAPITVNPFEQYMGEAVESIANSIVFRTLNEHALKPLLPKEALEAFEALQDAEGENEDLRKQLDALTTRDKVLKEEIAELKKQGRASSKELIEARDQAYDLIQALKKAEQKYAALEERSEQRLQQAKAEGAARAAEIKTRERARAAKQTQALKDHYREKEARAKERREESAGASKYRKQVEVKAGKLYELLMTNSDKLHVPKVLREPLAEFLTTLDFTSKRQLRGGEETRKDQAFAARLMRLQQLLSGQQDYLDGKNDTAVDLGGYIDVSPDNLQFLKDTAEMITQAMSLGKTFTVNQMTAAQLKDLSKFLSALYTAINNMNRFMANARYETVREAARGDISHMREMGKAGERSNGRASSFAMWDNGTPYYVFKRFGDGGRAIFEGFTKGWDQMAFDAQEIINFTANLYTDKEVNDWKAKVHEITLEDGSEIEMTTAQIMELAMLTGREQAMKHIAKGGIRIGDFETKKGEKHDTNHYHLTEGDLREIIGILTERQMTVARALQRYMADKGAKWGNEVSMRRFGYEFYIEGPNYYPIRTDANDRPMADTDAQMNSMFRLLNLSSSKSLNPRASNALIVGNIFDTFADHMADMAKLHGMGLPVLDAIKWFNFKERIDHEDGTYDTLTMQGAMEEAFGKPAQKYFKTLMKDINGMTESGDRGSSIFGKLISNYKIAAVGANLRVALLQPTSYARATVILDPKHMIGVLPSRAAYREALKWSGTAVWKSLGYYDTDIARSMRGQIKHDNTVKDKIAEASMTLAEKGDQLTWSMLWTACKRQAKAENRSLTGDALMQAAADLFREVVYSSQVMDSTLTRSEIMRGKTLTTKSASAFMAEPTLSYNILLDAYSNYQIDQRKYGKGEAWQRNGAKIGKAFAVYVTSALLPAIMESLVDAGRDDDDEAYLDKFLQAFIGKDGKFWTGNFAQDLTILGKLPYIKDFINTIQGYTGGNLSGAAFNNLVNALKIWEETARLNLAWLPEDWKLEKPTKVTYYGKMTPWGKIYKTLQAVSQLSGIAASNMTRDVVAIWNTVMNGRKDEWKIKTYDNGRTSSKQGSVYYREEQQAAYQEFVSPLGISEADYKQILEAANADGNTSVKQEEMGNYLRDSDLTDEQKEAIWNAQGWKTDYSAWLKKNGGTAEEPEETAKPAETKAPTKETAEPKATKPLSDAAPRKPVEAPKQKIATYDDYKAADVPIYNDNLETAYQMWESEVKPTGIDLDTYVAIVKAANADGKNTATQDEMGEYLIGQLEKKKMSQEQAKAIWHSIWNKPKSTTLEKWYAKHYG